MADVPIFSLKLSPENICIAGLRHKHNTVSSCLGPQSLQEWIINLKLSIQFLNNLGILINHLFFFFLLMFYVYTLVNFAERVLFSCSLKKKSESYLKVKLDTFFKALYI